ncbi:MAG TPA: VOC family protein [Polyangiaceae bacterium]|nr:VOC family protein [Polyangiaceae bacterium]
MARVESIGIRRLEAIHYYVHDLERSQRFYTDKLGFACTARSGAELVEGGHQRALVFESGNCRVVCSSPVGEGGRAHRYLAKHPDGVGSLIFEVENIERAFALLETRGGTPIHEIQETRTPTGGFKSFVIATPFGDTTFRFLERTGDFTLYPGFEALAAPVSDVTAPFLTFDHVTSNFETMSPALLWLEHVLGFERFWHVEFHTDDVRQRVDKAGSGLRSVVMWDPQSQVKFACNEPYRPNFKASQINVFHEQHRGDGVQHVALTVRDILSCVERLRTRGVEFMPTPKAYYDALRARLTELGVGDIAEPVARLEELGILVDGAGRGRYLLQIFLKDSAHTYGSEEAGPFFYELIQRAGDPGFGAGNFRALFESIEREQLSERDREPEATTKGAS